MRILHTVYSLNKKLGGPSSCIYQLAIGLNEIGAETNILSIADKRNKDDIIDNSIITYVKNDMCTPLGISRNFGKYLEQYVNHYDIIHGNTIWLWPTHKTSRTAHKYDKPVVLSTHGMLYPEALKVSSWKKKLILPLFQRKDFNNANLLHATSTQEMIHLRNFGLKNPIAIIPNSLALDEIPEIRYRENSIRRFAFVGRINRIKNIDVLLQSWVSLGIKTCDCELLIIGSGDISYEQELRHYIEMRGIKNVFFTGFKSGEELAELINSLDCLILPSKSENFGMVVPEALINGVPVIASTGTPWQELRDTGCGYWVDPQKAKLAEAIMEMIEIPEQKRKSMGKIGRDLVINKYLSSSVARQMLLAYEWLISGGEPPKCIYL